MLRPGNGRLHKDSNPLRSATDVTLIANDAVLQAMRSFLNESVYQNMLPLFIGPTVLFVSKEPKAKEMLSTLRASPQMTLLGRILVSICVAEGTTLVPLAAEKSSSKVPSTPRAQYKTY